MDVREWRVWVDLAQRENARKRMETAAERLVALQIAAYPHMGEESRREVGESLRASYERAIEQYERHDADFAAARQAKQEAEWARGWEQLGSALRRKNES